MEDQSFLKLKIIYLTGSFEGLMVQQQKTLPNNGQNRLNILTVISKNARHDMIFVLTKINISYLYFDLSVYTMLPVHALYPSTI